MKTFSNFEVADHESCVHFVRLSFVVEIQLFFESKGQTVQSFELFSMKALVGCGGVEYKSGTVYSYFGEVHPMSKYYPVDVNEVEPSLFILPETRRNLAMQKTWFFGSNPTFGHFFIVYNALFFEEMRYTLRPYFEVFREFWPFKKIKLKTFSG